VEGARHGERVDAGAQLDEDSNPFGQDEFLIRQVLVECPSAAGVFETKAAALDVDLHVISAHIDDFEPFICG
jgi:hypothetical protein